jgi:hypothetical protein
LSGTCNRPVVFSGFSGFVHQLNWMLRYNWNIVESGVKHHIPNPVTLFVCHKHWHSSAAVNECTHITQYTLTYRKLPRMSCWFYFENVCPTEINVNKTIYLAKIMLAINWWPTISPISTKRTITFYLKWFNLKIVQLVTLVMQVLARNKHTNVAGWSQLTESQFPHVIIRSPCLHKH